MKLSFKSFIKKYLQRVGIYIRFCSKLKIQYFRTPKHFYNYINSQSKNDRESELKRITNALRITKDHSTYEKFLKAFVPNWEVKIANSAFIGRGIGESSLNTYRRVEIEDKCYFEKIYFNRHLSVKHVQLFQTHLFRLVKDKIKVPRIQKTYCGELLTIVYFDYFILNELPEVKKENRLIQFSKDLYRISCRNETYLKKLELPDSVKDFRLRTRFQENTRSVKARLLKQNIDATYFEALLDRSKYIITHGDLHGGNIYKGGILIDWDFYGIYPIGLDPAYIYFRLIIKDNKKYNASDWLKKHYGAVVTEADWSGLERNFMYILFIFSIRYFEKGQFESFEQQLIKKLRYYNNMAEKNEITF
jgi:hypothetical protein